jgi:hypothetical protein
LTVRRNIWTVDPYVYRATVSGLQVYDLSSEILINFIPVSSGVNSVWADISYVYIGTTNSGVYRCSSAVAVSGTSFTEYKSYPNITSNEVVYLHGKGNYLCVSTASGVDRFTLSNGSRTYESAASPEKCFQTSGGDYYYYINNSPAELHAVYSGGGYTYEAEEGGVIGPVSFNDIYVTEGTSIYDEANVLFLATSSGAYVVEEKRGDEENCRKRIYYLDT